MNTTALVLALVVGYVVYRELHSNLLYGGVGAVAAYLLVKGVS
jgi:hypothetical protein